MRQLALWLAAAVVSVGCKGAAGTAGATGSPGQSVSVVALAVGDPGCPHGGTKFIQGAAASFACNGAPVAAE